jgi:hypothetical protein
MPDIPDWLWQGLTVTAIGTAAIESGKYVWTHRKEIAVMLRRTPQPIELIGNARISTSARGSMVVTKNVNLLWNTEAPTPSRAERLIDEGLELLSLLSRHL